MKNETLKKNYKFSKFCLLFMKMNGCMFMETLVWAESCAVCTLDIAWFLSPGPLS